MWREKKKSELRGENVQSTPIQNNKTIIIIHYLQSNQHKHKSVEIIISVIN